MRTWKVKTSHFGQISVNFSLLLIPSISWTMSTVELPRRPGYIACGYQLNLSSGIVFRSSRTRPYPIFLTMTPGRRSNGQTIVVGLPPPPNFLNLTFNAYVLEIKFISHCNIFTLQNQYCSWLELQIRRPQLFTLSLSFGSWSLLYCARWMLNSDTVSFVTILFWISVIA